MNNYTFGILRIRQQNSGPVSTAGGKTAVFMMSAVKVNNAFCLKQRKLLVAAVLFGFSSGNIFAAFGFAFRGVVFFVKKNKKKNEQ